MKRIAILTSGGDAPGMNPCIRAVVRTAEYFGLEIFGVRRGYLGLIENDFIRLTGDDVSGIAQQGGTMLKSARLKNFQDLALQKQAADNLKALDIEGLVVIGGDGSFRGAKDLSDNFGINCACLPATIDNDLAYTNYTIGFPTACETVIACMDRLRDTFSSHQRICIMEVMGRHCGDIALYAGIAGSADAILIPGIDVDYDELAKKLVDNRNKSRNANIVVVAEGFGTCTEVREELSKRMDPDMLRDITLGHVQRGGRPTMQDVINATKMGSYAVKKVLLEDRTCRAIGINHGDVFDLDITEALSVPRDIRKNMYELSKIVAH